MWTFYINPLQVQAVLYLTLVDLVNESWRLPSQIIDMQMLTRHNTQKFYKLYFKMFRYFKKLKNSSYIEMRNNNANM